MRQFENDERRKLAQPAQSTKAFLGVCASAPVRQSPLGTAPNWRGASPAREHYGGLGGLAPRTGARLARLAISPVISPILTASRRPGRRQTPS
jgi:hypothetical protein